MDGLLSQEEINALFSSNMDDDVDTTSHSDLLSPEEKDAIGEISNISMGTSATTLSELVNKLNRMNASVMHLKDMVEDFLAAC